MTISTKQQALNTLKQYWGFDSFRSIQANVIDSILNKKDTIAIAPTSLGKSVMFQVPALIFDGVTIVVSPLKALQTDQVESLEKKGISAALLNSDLGVRAKKKLTDQLIKKEIKLLYVAPETLLGDAFTPFKNLIDVSLIVTDEAHCCFRGTSEIHTEYGKVSFQFLHKMFENNLPLPKVKSFNNSTETIEYKEIVQVFKNPFKKMQTVTFQDGGGRIDSTEDHLFFTTEGEKKAKDLVKDDIVISSNPTKALALSPDQLSLVFGSLLGDGGLENLNEDSFTHRIKFTHGYKQKNYLGWKNKLLGYQDVTTIDKNGYSGKPAVSAMTISFFLKENFYPVKRGTLRPALSDYFFNHFDLKVLAIWYMDDGSLALNKTEKSGRITIACCSFSDELCNQIKKHLKQSWDIDLEIIKNKGYNSMKLNSENTYKMLLLISPYLHPDLIYKTYFPELVDLNTWDYEESLLPQYTKVLSSEPSKDQTSDFLYDIEVKDNHNYFIHTHGKDKRLTTQNTVLVHNCSQWGDFRPQYQKLHLLSNMYPNVPKLAVTATADDLILKDIVNNIGFKNYNLFKADLDRPNIELNIFPVTKTPSRHVIDVIESFPSETKGIIYCSSREKTKQMASYLSAVGYKAIPYHAAIKKSEKEKAQEDYTNGSKTIICATIAFGMGIDIPDIRYVIHVDAPDTFESYNQQWGRLSRDGELGYAYMFYDPSSYRIAMWLNKKSTKDPARLAIKNKKLRKFHSFCASNVCRRKQVLEVFGQSFNKPNCGSCDVCLNKTSFRGK